MAWPKDVQLPSKWPQIMQIQDPSQPEIPGYPPRSLMIVALLVFWREYSNMEGYKAQHSCDIPKCKVLICQIFPTWRCSKALSLHENSSLTSPDTWQRLFGRAGNRSVMLGVYDVHRNMSLISWNCEQLAVESILKIGHWWWHPPPDTRHHHRLKKHTAQTWSIWNLYITGVGVLHMNCIVNVLKSGVVFVYVLEMST